jgi:hypothetical protein
LLGKFSFCRDLNVVSVAASVFGMVMNRRSPKKTSWNNLYE